jgi:hypothetical protein
MPSYVSKPSRYNHASKKRSFAHPLRGPISPTHVPFLYQSSDGASRRPLIEVDGKVAVDSRFGSFGGGLGVGLGRSLHVWLSLHVSLNRGCLMSLSRLLHMCCLDGVGNESFLWLLNGLDVRLCWLNMCRRAFLGGVNDRCTGAWDCRDIGSVGLIHNVGAVVGTDLGSKVGENVGMNHLSGVIDNIGVVEGVVNILGLDHYVGSVISLDNGGYIDRFVALLHRGGEPDHVSLHHYLEAEILTQTQRACQQEGRYRNAFCQMILDSDDFCKRRTNVAALTPASSGCESHDFILFWIQYKPGYLKREQAIFGSKVSKAGVIPILRDVHRKTPSHEEAFALLSDLEE